MTMLWPSSNVCDTSESGRDDASRRARVMLVVELGVLELRELERQRLLEDLDVDALAELLAQQAAHHAEQSR